VAEAEPPTFSSAAQDSSSADADRDVVAGFPLQRLISRILYGNMMFIGGCFLLLMLGETLETLRFIRNFREVFEDPLHDLEHIWSDTREVVAEEPTVLLAWAIPGSLGGLVWYLAGRCCDSLLLKKRRPKTLSASAKSTKPILQ
jgi:hypothetical protein